MHTPSWHVSNLMKVLQSDVQVWLEATNTSPEITVQLSSVCHTKQMWINCGRTLEGNNVIKDDYYLTLSWQTFAQWPWLFPWPTLNKIQPRGQTAFHLVQKWEQLSINIAVSFRQILRHIYIKKICICFRLNWTKNILLPRWFVH